jgi:hypothetical protein
VIYTLYKREIYVPPHTRVMVVLHIYDSLSLPPAADGEAAAAYRGTALIHQK